MRATRLLAALLCALLLCRPAFAASTGGVSVGYLYGGGAAARGYTIEDIPAKSLTHIHYAFGEVDTETYQLALMESESDLENLAALRRLRQENPDLRLILSVGGWSDSNCFSDMAATAENREIFAQSCLDMLLEQELDGIDLDWEFPVSGGPAGMVHRPEDKQNYTLLLRAIRSKMDRQTALTGRTYDLSIAAGDSASFLEKIEPKALSEVTDYIFLMGYDYCGAWSQRTQFNAPLDRLRASVRDYIEAGVPADKLVLGMPLYGRRFEGTSAANGGLNSAFSKTSSITYDALVEQYLSSPACRLYRNSASAVPYLFDSGTFISYDDPASAAAKAGMAREMGLRGIGFWEISQNRTGTMIRTAWDVFRGSGEGDFSDLVPDSWYTEAVVRAVEEEWMAGIAPRVFSPETPVTRGDFAAALYRMADGDAAGDAAFSDVPADHAAAAAAAWCAANGIVTGYGDNTFRPDNSITREQMAVMLLRFVRYKALDVVPGASLSGFQDAGQVHAYAQEAVAWAVGAELLKGQADGRLTPGGTASRGETAVILSRFADNCLA